MLEVTDLVVRYGPVQAVSDMRLTATPGRITLVLARMAREKLQHCEQFVVCSAR